MKVDASVATISIKNFPSGLHVMYLYFPDTPRISTYSNIHGAAQRATLIFNGHQVIIFRGYHRKQITVLTLRHMSAVREVDLRLGTHSASGR
jgi:hypothetical protein